MINLSTCTHFGFNQCAICYFAAFSEFWTCVYHHDAHIYPCWSMLSWYDIIVISKLTSPQLLSTYVSRFFSTTKSVIISIFIQIFFPFCFTLLGHIQLLLCIVKLHFRRDAACGPTSAPGASPALSFDLLIYPNQ